MKNKVIWLTGLPCSGKTTIAKILSNYIPNSLMLDGDDLRGSPISSDLGFSKEDRDTNIRRVGYIAKLLYGKGITVICSFVSPIRDTRNKIRESIGKDFIEVFVGCAKEECIRRDVKGMWAKALSGEIKDFTGHSALYEMPADPEVICDTVAESVDESISKIMSYLNKLSSRAFYIGRWAAGKDCLHAGHVALIKKSLDKGIPVLIGVRDTLPDHKNPLSAEYRKNKIEEFFIGEDVKVIIIPNIRSVDYGRDVGYKIIRHETDVKSISGTKIREKEGLNVKYDNFP